jgi:hypothetical protein
MGRKRVNAPCWPFIFFMFKFFFKNICLIQKISKMEAYRPLGATGACRPLDRRQALCVVFFHLGPFYFFSFRSLEARYGGRSPPAGDRGAVPCLLRCSPPPLSFELKNQRKIKKKRGEGSGEALPNCVLVICRYIPLLL